MINIDKTLDVLHANVLAHAEVVRAFARTEPNEAMRAMLSEMIAHTVRRLLDGEGNMDAERKLVRQLLALKSLVSGEEHVSPLV